MPCACWTSAPCALMVVCRVALAKTRARVAGVHAASTPLVKTSIEPLAAL
jgi:hypothetical protein